MKAKYFQDAKGKLICLIQDIREEVKYTKRERAFMRIFDPYTLEEMSLGEVFMLESEEEVSKSYVQNRIEAFIEKIKQLTGYSALEQKISEKYWPQSRVQPSNPHSSCQKKKFH